MNNTSFKIGLEKEMFLIGANNVPILVPSYLPQDECHLLLEARGLPHNDITEAVFSLKADVDRINRKIVNTGLGTMSDVPFAAVSRATFRESLRISGKGPVKHQNLYGHTSHRVPSNTITAGIHISFTSPKTIYGVDGKVNTTVNGIFDYIQLFRQLDECFADEIKNSRRRPGFYELKPDGRIEYRSLPANTDLNKIIGVLEAIFSNNSF